MEVASSSAKEEESDLFMPGTITVKMGLQSSFKAAIAIELMLSASDRMDDLTQSEDEQYASVERWLGNHTDFVEEYFSRKASRAMVDNWLMNHALTRTKLADSASSSSCSTPVRKISSQDFESPSGALQPMVSTVDGSPTFLSPDFPNDVKGTHKGQVTLKSIDEKSLMWELVTDICNDLDIDSVCHKILCYVSVLISADRCSLFLVHGSEPRNRCLVSKLFNVNGDSDMKECLTNGDEHDKIYIPWGKGIAGYVAEHGQSVVIPDAYKDLRFHTHVDELTGYKTKSLMCLPIKDTNGDIIGVAQAVNKTEASSGVFNEDDQKTFSSYLAFCGIVLRNAQLYERSRLENKRNQVLLDLARVVCEEQSRLGILAEKIMTHAQSLLQFQKCQILLVAEETKTVFTKVFELEVGNVVADSDNKKQCKPLNTDITGYVATTGQTINIEDISLSDKFAGKINGDCVPHTKSVLCVPIRSADHQRVIGVFLLINKIDGSYFTKNDEQIFEAFAIFCGIGIENTVMHDKVCQAQARQSVALEILAYHTAASPIEVEQLKTRHISSSQALGLLSFSFSDFSLSDDQTIESCLRMFLDLDLVEKFHISYECLCRWLISVKKNYRDVSYHNWRHAFNVAQYMFAMLKTGRMMNIVSDLEALCLITACLCHDLDHRGTNNQFQLKSGSPLSRLYTTSVMEHHHFDHSIMLLNINGSQVFANLDSAQYEQAIDILEHAILATDLALYFKNRESFFQLVKTGQADWNVPHNRRLLFGMMMTACDVSSITKPWQVQKKVAYLVADEFFQQGDLEKSQLHENPIPMMDRNRVHEVPSLQVQFIDAICLPVYKSFAELSPYLRPMLEGCERNHDNWSILAQENNKRKQLEAQNNQNNNNST